MQYPLHNRITSGRHKSDNNIRMIQSTDVFYALSIYNEASDFWSHLAADSIICDPIKWRALYYVLNEIYFSNIGARRSLFTFNHVP